LVRNLVSAHGHTILAGSVEPFEKDWVDVCTAAVEKSLLFKQHCFSKITACRTALPLKSTAFQKHSLSKAQP